MNTEECCNHNCNQGRDCPLRNKDLTDESFDRTASHMAGEYVSYPAKTLTDEEIEEVWHQAMDNWKKVDDGTARLVNQPFVFFARAILRKAQEK
jgi:hypothetical protein